MMIDKNGYSESLLNTEEDVCYLCKKHTKTARHEIFGASNRSFSKKLGLWINVCPGCHSSIHLNPLDYIPLKEEGQRAFEREYGHARFVAVFSRNYLEEEEWTD